MGLGADVAIIVGLCAGLVVSTFSKSLALILGLLVVGVQVRMSPLERRRGADQRTVGTKLRHPHYSIQSLAKVLHER
jgi:hypothetical protein